MPLRLLVCLLLFAISLSAAAREVRLSGADGDGACPESAAGENATVIARNPGKRAADEAAREKGAVSRSAEAGTSVARPPRWHSFLPGMFR